MKQFNLLVLTALMLVASACVRPPELIRFQGEAQGTYYAVTYYDQQGRNLQPEVDSILVAFDQVASLWVENSILSRYNRNDSDVVLDPMLIEMTKLSLSIAEETQGAFDITVGPLVNAWGFGFRNEQMPDSAHVDSLLEFIGWHRLELIDEKLIKEDPRIAVDMNAIAQGYAVDLLGEFLESKGITDYLVDIGGEVLAHGKKPDGSLWKIGIEKPAESPTAERQLQEVVEFTDKAMATSGSYRKFYERDGVKYAHTIDPRTGYPVSHRLLSVSVLAGNATLADAYATALMVMGTEEAKTMVSVKSGLEAYLIYTDENGEYLSWKSDGLKQMIVDQEE